MSKLWYDNVIAVNYFNNMGEIKSQTLSAEYDIFMSKINSGLQQHIYQEQSILKEISNPEH